ncbi:hypothetical protein CH352_00405 [Leptospira hartskeerlii]|uniref:Uncharacterized protein n=1 Tax=Leptospira hartskeerlii TaxID=2023177 RepID=A0A2M9X9B9_9LEPT|nr:hypothetical protein CH357_17510 [Leptospira hartskeerlii]PJZ35136.1 hypothetical protein CH352_00405 [Leptospira hartskeerlii]
MNDGFHTKEWLSKVQDFYRLSLQESRKNRLLEYQNDFWPDPVKMGRSKSRKKLVERPMYV